MLTIEKTALVLIDVQGKLAQLMHNREALFKQLQVAIKGMQALGAPIFWLEQNPAGLGATIPELAGLLAAQKPIAKMSFSCCGSAEFMLALKASGRAQVLLAGIEAHVCVYQTARDLLAARCDVEVVADCVSSRSAENRLIGLEKMRAAGAGITCVETALFELLRTAESPKFKEVVRLVK
jgi:nicotinamidase-related amidase